MKVTYSKIMSALWPYGQICHQLTLTKIHFYLYHSGVMKFNLTSENMTTNFQPFQFWVSTSSFCHFILPEGGFMFLDQSCGFIKWQRFTPTLFFFYLSTLWGIICLPNKRNVSWWQTPFNVCCKRCIYRLAGQTIVKYLCRPVSF